MQNDVFEEDNEPLIPEQVVPSLQLPAAAAVPSAAAVVEMEEQQPGDALNIADIFAFMR